MSKTFSGSLKVAEFLNFWYKKFFVMPTPSAILPKHGNDRDNGHAREEFTAFLKGEVPFAAVRQTNVGKKTLRGVHNAHASCMFGSSLYFSSEWMHL